MSVAHTPRLEQRAGERGAASSTPHRHAGTPPSPRFEPQCACGAFSAYLLHLALEADGLIQRMTELLRVGAQHRLFALQLGTDRAAQAGSDRTERTVGAARCQHREEALTLCARRAVVANGRAQQR